MAQRNVNVVISLKSLEEEVFEVDEYVVSQSQLLRNIANLALHSCDTSTSSAAPVLNDDARPPPAAHELVPFPFQSCIVLKVMEFCRWHAALHVTMTNPSCHVVPADPLQLPTLTSAASDFFNALPPSTATTLLQAADYLDMKILMDASATYVANKIRGKTSEQLRKGAKLPNDLTPEEVEKTKHLLAYIKPMVSRSKFMKKVRKESY